MVAFDANVEGVCEAFVGTDNFQSVELIVEYLCRSGEPPCFFEMKTPSNPNANKRRQAYLEAMERHGFAPHIHQVPGEGWNFEEIGAIEGTEGCARLALTDEDKAGRDLVESVDKAWKRLEREAMAGLDDKDRKKLRKLLRQVEKNLSLSFDQDPEHESDLEPDQDGALETA